MALLLLLLLLTVRQRPFAGPSAASASGFAAWSEVGALELLLRSTNLLNAGVALLL